jgi:Arrestin (or S-antigen), N-terminal domain
VRTGSQYRGLPKLARNFRFHKKTNTIRLELDKTIFSQGEKIYGRIVLMNITQPDKIRKIEIVLSGIEFATIDTEGTINQAVNLMQGLQPVDLCCQNKMEEYTKEIEIPKKERDNIIIPFEFQIPKQVKRSYTGKYSKFYWLVDAKIDLKGMVDSHTDEEITII